MNVKQQDKIKNNKLSPIIPSSNFESKVLLDLTRPSGRGKHFQEKMLNKEPLNGLNKKRANRKNQLATCGKIKGRDKLICGREVF